MNREYRLEKLAYLSEDESLIKLANEKIIGELTSKFPNLANDFSFLRGKNKYCVWLKSRYLTNEKREAYPIEHTLPSLKSYSEKEASILSKIKSPEFMAAVSEDDVLKSLTAQAITNIENLTTDQMDRLVALASPPKTTVDTTNVKISPEEFVGKVGEWNIWLPHTQETSAKIAGYSSDTKKPYTEWCTARTTGSNLFYNYVGRSSELAFLFYIIKDNPKSSTDWLSLGFLSTADFEGNPIMEGFEKPNL